MLNSVSPKTNKPYSNGTIGIYISDISSFYEFYGFTIPRRVKKFDLGTPDEKVNTHCEPDFDKQIITDMLDKADVLGQASSGLSNSDLLNLRIDTFKNGLHSSGITVFKNMVRQKMRKKTPVKFITFFSKEATETINAYLEYRNTPPIQPTPSSTTAYERRKVISDRNYIFVKRRISDPTTKRRNGKPTQNIRDKDRYRRLNVDAIYEMYNRLYPCKKEPSDWNSVRGHLLRKFFHNVLIKNAVQKEYAETMMGHSLGGSRDHYYQPGIDLLIESYLKCEDDLTFTNKVLLKEAKEDLKDIENLKAENTDMKEHIPKQHDQLFMISEELKQFQEEFDEVKREIEENKKALARVNIWKKAEAAGLTNVQKTLEKKASEIIYLENG